MITDRLHSSSFPGGARRQPRPATDRQRTIRRLNDLWSEYIRKRAMHLIHGCQACKSWRNSYKELQAAHCFGRDNKTTQWHPLNGAGLCGDCHRYIDTHQEAKYALFRDLIGNSKDFELLWALSHLTTKQYPIDYNLTEIQLKERIRQLDGVVATT